MCDYTFPPSVGLTFSDFDYIYTKRKYDELGIYAHINNDIHICTHIHSCANLLKYIE